MEKKYQVFVSTTYDDLVEERKAISQALLECGCIPAGMELFPASNSKQWSIIKDVIDESDYYLLIIAGRYGSTCKNESGDVVSYTEMEYEYAREKGKPIVAFIHNNIKKIPAEFCEQTNNGKARLKRFIKKVSDRGHYKKWSTKEELSSIAVIAIQNLIKNNPSCGWVRGVPEDLNSYSEEDKERIYKLLFANMYLPKAQDDLKIKELSEIQFERLKLKTKQNIYLESFERELTITLENDYIFVENTWVQIFRNIIGENYTYMRSPWLLPGVELDSYRFTQILHNRKPVNPEQYQPLNPPQPAANNKYFIKYDIKIPFDNLEKQTLIIKNSYKTNYAEFFHTYTFDMYCEIFNLRARIIDNRNGKRTLMF